MKRAIFFGLATLFIAGTLALARNTEKSYLTVNADPGAVLVYVDGQLMGPAVEHHRLKKYELPAGSHTVRIVQEGYVESTQHVYLTPGRVSNLPIALRPNTVPAESRTLASAPAGH